jgi:hypothetical protein
MYYLEWFLDWDQLVKSGFNFHQTLLFGLDEMWFPTSITRGYTWFNKSDIRQANLGFVLFDPAVWDGWHLLDSPDNTKEAWSHCFSSCARAWNQFYFLILQGNYRLWQMFAILIVFGLSQLQSEHAKKDADQGGAWSFFGGVVYACMSQKDMARNLGANWPTNSRNIIHDSTSMR